MSNTHPRQYRAAGYAALAATLLGPVDLVINLWSGFRLIANDISWFVIAAQVVSLIHTLLWFYVYRRLRDYLSEVHRFDGARRWLTGLATLTILVFVSRVCQEIIQAIAIQSENWDYSFVFLGLITVGLLVGLAWGVASLVVAVKIRRRVGKTDQSIYRYATLKIISSALVLSILGSPLAVFVQVVEGFVLSSILMHATKPTPPDTPD